MTLAVVAAVRHKYTKYDELLAAGAERAVARQLLADKIDDILEKWREN